MLKGLFDIFSMPVELLPASADKQYQDIIPFKQPSSRGKELYSIFACTFIQYLQGFADSQETAVV